MSLLLDDASSESLLFTVTPLAAQPMTIGCWARSDVVNINQTPFSFGDIALDNQYWALVWASATLAFRRQAGVTTADANQTTLVADTWHHCVGVQSTATSATAYLDGSAGTAETTSIEPTGADTVTIGRRASTTSTLLFSGNVLWPFLYNTDLTAAEIQMLADGVHPTKVRRANLVFAPSLHQPDNAAGIFDPISGTVVTTVAGTPVVDVNLAGLEFPRDRIRPYPDANYIHS